MTRHITAYNLRFAGCLTMLLAATACDGFSVHRHYSRNATFSGPTERPLGMISFNEENDDESTRRLHLYKIQKGYALKTHLISTEKHATDLVISKDKDKHTFAGIQLKWVF